jgi:hypothetical protein
VRWKVHGRRTMYESDWVDVHLDDVELPDGTHIDHHVLAMPKAAQTAVVLDDTGDHVLLLWRHRFVTDKWGWEVPFAYSSWDRKDALRTRPPEARIATALARNSALRARCRRAPCTSAPRSAGAAARQDPT